MTEKKIEKIKLKSGFEAEIDRENIDWRMLKKIRKLQKTQNEEEEMELTIDLYERILGEEQAEKLEEFLADEKGRVSIDKITESLREIFNYLAKDQKNH